MYAVLASFIWRHFSDRYLHFCVRFVSHNCEWEGRKFYQVVFSATLLPGKVPFLGSEERLCKNTYIRFFPGKLSFFPGG